MYPASAHVRKAFEKLVALLPTSETTKPQIIFIAGEVTPFRNDTDRELTFRQESNFYYLTGCTVPGSYLLATYQPGTSLDQKPSIDLYVPEANEDDIMWSVPPPSLKAATQTHDVSRVNHTTALPEAISTLLAAFPEALVHTLTRDSPLFPSIPQEYISSIVKSDSVAITDAYLLSAFHIARLIKDFHEIEAIRHANMISSRAHETVMRMLGQTVKAGLKRGAQEAAKTSDRPLLPGEWLIEKEAEAEAIFVASCRREGSVHQAYLPIVAASTRASTLHYCCNDRAFAWGPLNPNDLQNNHKILPQVLLIDAGCEWSCYASDITRTMPVGNGGKFTPESRAIYSLVLGMQNASFEKLRPGLHWDEVQLVCHRTLIRGFKKLGIFRADKEEDEILASGISAAFFPHGLGHSLGLDVHDVPSASKPIDRLTGKVLAVGNGGREVAIGAVGGDVAEKNWGPEILYKYLRLRLPLEKGMVVTVEPGIYFSPHLLERAQVHVSPFVDGEVLKKYEGMGGVRIEDVVHITEEGYENLTTVRSDVEWVEGVCSGQI